MKIIILNASRDAFGPSFYKVDNMVENMQLSVPSQYIIIITFT